MRATKRTSKLKSHKEVAPALGAVGILSLAGGASAATVPPSHPPPSELRQGISSCYTRKRSLI